LPQERRSTGICPGAPSLQHLNLWPANHRLQKVCICWRSCNHAYWRRLAGSGRDADQGHGNCRWIPPDLDLKLSTTKTVSAVYHLNNKEDKRELKVKYNNETLPFCSEPKYLGVTLDRSFMYRRHLELLCKNLTSRAAFLRRLAGSGKGAGATTLRTATLALVHSTAEHCTPVCATVLIPASLTPPSMTLANCDWMPASYTSRQPVHPLKHPTCWASSHWSHTVSRMPCHGPWTSSPLNAHRPIEHKRTAPKIKTPIWTCCATTHQFIWQQHTCGAVGGLPMECGLDGQPHKTPHFHLWHWHPLSGRTPPKKSLGPA